MADRLAITDFDAAGATRLTVLRKFGDRYPDIS
jgi:hypothetical protein